jgi:hypothetical protein
MREVLALMIQEAEYDKLTKRKVIQERRKLNDPLLQEKDAQDDLYEGISCEPTVGIYNTLIQGLSQAATRSIQSAIEAEEVLSTMEKMQRKHGWHTKPTTRSYSLVLDTYANCRHKTSGVRAEAVLRKMIQQHDQDREVYFQQYDEEYNARDPDANRRNIVTPDTIAYTTVMKAYKYSDAPDSAERSLALLSELLHADNPAIRLDGFPFAVTISAYASKAEKKKSAKERFDAAQQAEDIWWLMVEEIKKNVSSEGDDDNSSSDQNSLSGDIVPFNAALNAWAVSFTPDSPRRAEDLLYSMMEPELQELTKIHPDTVSLNTVMQAWAKAAKVQKEDAPERAEELLKLMKDFSLKENLGKKISPNVQSYVTVMNAYAVSRREDSVFHVRRLLNDLLEEGRAVYLDDGAKINAVPFTIVLKAASKAQSKQMNDKTSSEEDVDYDVFGTHDLDERNTNNISSSDPYTIALETYAGVQNDVHNVGVTADHFFFAAMLDVIAEHTDIDSIERRQRIEEIFYDACQAGQVSSLVVRSIQNACPNEVLMKEVLQLRRDDDVVSIESVNVFPKQWTRLVPPEFRRVSNRQDHFRKKSNHFQKSTNKNENHHHHHHHRGVNNKFDNSKTTYKGDDNGKGNSRRKNQQVTKDFIF